MVTVRELMLKRLHDNGMFEEQAEQVMVMAEAGMESMKDNWNKPADGYPSVVINVTWISVKQFALQWIESNAPEAWFKAMFQ